MLRPLAGIHARSAAGILACHASVSGRRKEATCYARKIWPQRGLSTPDFLPRGLLGESSSVDLQANFQAQHADTANHQRPFTQLKSNLSPVFNKCSRPRLDIRNSAAILRAVNRSNHKRPCTKPCSNACKGKQDLARTLNFQKPEKTCKILQSTFLYH